VSGLALPERSTRPGVDAPPTTRTVVPRYVFVTGSSPLAAQAQFSLDDTEIPFYDPDAVRVVREGDFEPIGRYARPRGGAVLVLSQRR
jgi:hypothetical protein